MPKSLSEISREDLVEITTLAELFFTPDEIALMLEIDRAVMIDQLENNDSEIYRAFQTGRLQSEMELRKSIVKLAKSGSSPAQTMAMDMLTKSKLKMMG
jgi:hypothetical protein